MEIPVVFFGSVGITDVKQLPTAQMYDIAEVLHSPSLFASMPQAEDVDSNSILL